MTPEASPGLRRVLGPWSAGALVAGTMIGTGIFTFVSPVAQRLSSPALILAAWACGAAIAACGALCLCELAAARPETGGIYVFLRDAFGKNAGFLFAWTHYLVIRVASLAIFALIFRETVGVEGAGFALIALVVGVNVAGVRPGAVVQNLFTGAKVLCLLLLGVAGFLHAGASSAAPSTSGWTDFALALVPVMWAYGGWEDAPYVAGEVRDPQR
ncbi:MAG: APC family permease, partial [Planctomycetota bacterium]